MPLTPGTTLGHYDVTALLGEGGMGQVWQATDTHLGRQVALKILPDAFAADPDRLARFTREAQILASLNHPNIAQIHGIEEAAGTRALVLELVEGPTLADRIAQGAMPTEDALPIARQIAEALEAAHEAGVIHRDLKPANIKVKDDGTVKVLDFGLAKALDPGNDTDPTQSPTLTTANTQLGVILGTAAYMSPEQACGKAVDRRSDIWAFGCVVYEMLTGRATFRGANTPVILASVIAGTVDFDLLPADIHPVVRKVIVRCLSKDTRKRFRDMGDVVLELLDAAEPAAPPARATPPTRTPWLIAAAFGTVSVVALAALWRALLPGEADLQPLVRFDVDLGVEVSLGSPSGADVILSPDGARLVYVSANRLFTRRLAESTTTELPGTDGASAPFFSPDSQWVAFFAGGTLRRVPVQGGTPVEICACAGNPGGASWGDADFIVGAFNMPGPLSRITLAGGTPEDLGGTTPRVPTWPHVLPGSAAVLFASVSGPAALETATIDVYSFADGSRKTLVRGGTFPRYVPTGHLTYLNQGTLYAVPFDLDALEVRGDPVPVLEEVAFDRTGGFAQVDLAAEGTLVYQSGTARGSGEVMQWLDEDGETEPFLSQPGFYVYPRLSPGGQHLVVGQGVETRGAGVWVHELEGARAWPVSRGTGLVPVWTPDGQYIVFGGAGDLSWTRFDAADPPQVLDTGIQGAPMSFTPDGTLAIRVGTATVGFDMWTVPIEIGPAGLRAGTAEPLLTTDADERFLAFSPDGRWVAYSSNESGSYEVSVRAFPDTGRRWQLSSGGGTDPVWSPTGSELFYRADDSRFMVASYTIVGDEFVAGTSRTFASRPLSASAVSARNLGRYDVAGSGRRILAVMSAEAGGEEPARHHVVFLRNFFDELRRIVPIN